MNEATRQPDPAAQAERARRFFEDRLSFTTSPGQLDEARRADRARIIDVRTKEDFDASHIPGSVNLPRTRWADGDSVLAKDKPNVFLCYTEFCPLSAKAAAEFATKGYPVKELTGGFEAWKKHGLPTESGAGHHEEPVDRTRAFLEEKRANEEAAAQSQAAAAPDAGTDDTNENEEGEKEETPMNTTTDGNEKKDAPAKSHKPMPEKSDKTDDEKKEPPKNDKQALKSDREPASGDRTRAPAPPRREKPGEPESQRVVR